MAASLTFIVNIYHWHLVKIVQVIVGCVIDILTIETFKFKHFNMTTLSMKPIVKIY